MGGVDGEEGQGVGCRLCRKVLEKNKVDIGVESGAIGFFGGNINCLTKGESSLMDQAIHRPMLVFPLPWTNGGGWNHFCVAPSVHQGGWKGDILRSGLRVRVVEKKH